MLAVLSHIHIDRFLRAAPMCLRMAILVGHSSQVVSARRCPDPLATLQELVQFWVGCPFHSGMASQDDTMTYSSGIHSPGGSLQDAQLAKLDALIEMAGITAGDHVLEIGCGWGSLAIRAVQTTGCRLGQQTQFA
jgi:Mycolic acid cyclopropane synthetase